MEAVRKRAPTPPVVATIDSRRLTRCVVLVRSKRSVDGRLWARRQGYAARSAGRQPSRPRGRERVGCQPADLPRRTARRTTPSPSSAGAGSPLQFHWVAGIGEPRRRRRCGSHPAGAGALCRRVRKPPRRRRMRRHRCRRRWACPSCRRRSSEPERRSSSGSRSTTGVKRFTRSVDGRLRTWLDEGFRRIPMSSVGHGFLCPQRVFAPETVGAGS